MNRWIALLLLILLSLSSCTKKKEAIVELKTKYGNIYVKLYNGTPNHRDNFLKLVREGFYNGTIFHRVVNDYIIQGGDPTSKGASLKTTVGSGNLPYTIPSEIKYPIYFHKRGALCAARLNDDINPDKRSSACQFYIVDGKIFNDEELDDIEKTARTNYKKRLFLDLVNANKKELDSLKALNDKNTIYKLTSQMMLKVEREAINADSLFKIPIEVRRIYKTRGGIPELDGEYTVFGEVVAGFEVIGRISKIATSPNERPCENIQMSAYIIE